MMFAMGDARMHTHTHKTVSKTAPKSTIIMFSTMSAYLLIAQIEVCKGEFLICDGQKQQTAQTNHCIFKSIHVNKAERCALLLPLWGLHRVALKHSLALSLLPTLQSAGDRVQREAVIHTDIKQVYISSQISSILMKLRL